MGDLEATYLWEHGQLPDTQPYQAIIEVIVTGNFVLRFFRAQPGGGTRINI